MHFIASTLNFLSFFSLEELAINIIYLTNFIYKPKRSKKELNHQLVCLPKIVLKTRFIFLNNFLSILIFLVLS